jgi:hypothetical protein
MTANLQLPNDNNSIFTAKPVSLSSLLAGIHSHKTALPEFQRPWVWQPEMVRELIISVAYRYPAGSLLTMPVSSQSGFALRQFEGSGNALKDTPNLMVLDGQQRLTSLYQALYSRSGIYINRGKPNQRIFHFYLDIGLLMSDPVGSVEVSDPYFEKALYFVAEEKGGKRVRYDRITPLYEITSREDELKNGALPLGCLFKTDDYLTKWRKDYLRGKSGKNMDVFDALDDRWDNLRGYTFPVTELTENMPLHAICHIFEKVNSTGVALDVFDLCTAILWADGFKLNEEWAKTRHKLAALLPMQPLSGTYFLQGLALLSSMDKKRSSQSGAVSCRKNDLMALKKATVVKWWPVLVEGYVEAAKFMTSEGIMSERILPYSTQIMPLSTIFADLINRHKTANIGSFWPKIRQWYWCSVFTQRYSSQVETGAAKDYEEVVNWVEGSGPAPEVVRTFNFRADTLQEITSIRNAIYKGVLCLLAGRGAKDFGGGGDLKTNLFYQTRQDHHHIYPKAALSRKGDSDPRVDTIVNKTLINAAVNKSISDNLPSKYVREWGDRLQGSFGSILQTHLIDPDLLSSDDWNRFFEDRREKLRQLIMSVCGGTVQNFSGESADSVALEIEELDEEEMVVAAD